QRQGLINVWYDQDINAGTERQQEIDKHLNEAQIILLLVSPDFLASDYCYSVEIKRALERHAKGESSVVPIILRSCFWKNAPFGQLQILPKDAKPVASWANVDKALLEVAEGIYQVVIELTESRTSASIGRVGGKGYNTISPLTISIPDSIEQTEPIFLHSALASLPPPSTAPPSFQDIAGMPPPTNVKTIQQREKIVEYIYSLVANPDITFIALTGIGGVGKSTLAALVHEYAEKQRRSGTGRLTGESIWLEIQPNSTLVDVAGNLFQALGKPMPDFNHLSPYNQATELCRALNTADNPSLIILDQFERLLDWQTGMALPDRPGIDEWLDALNSQPCRCRILLTSRPTPQGVHNYPPTYMHEYVVEGMNIAEGAELLYKQGIQDGQATYTERISAATRCDGHAFSL
ncbi:MAG TPA: TIR domain-containing protein, partial [Methylomirabilota bacterium]|nr:TIR domain-containing protein [Methylomirabilota bacterium]